MRHLATRFFGHLNTIVCPSLHKKIDGKKADALSNKSRDPFLHV